jgi:hypothetical protein
VCSRLAQTQQTQALRWNAYRFNLGLVARIVEAVWGERITKGNKKETGEYICMCVCAPPAPQLAGDGNGVLASGGVGVAACVRTCKCIKSTLAFTCFD